VGERKGLDACASSLMIVLCIVWGLQQVVLKIAAADISPIMQIAIRSGLSALLVFPLIQLQQGTHLYSKAYLWPGIWLAFLFSAEFLLVAQALLYTAPIFVALGLHWKLPSERLSKVQWSGILIAFVGIVTTFIGRENLLEQGLSQVLWGDLLALLAGIMWALTTISLRLSKLNEAHPTQTLFYQLLGGFVFLFPLAFLLGQAEIHWTYIAIGSLVFHTLIMSFMSLMLWFWLLRNYLASHLGVFSFLTPIFGLLFGVLLLNETIEPNFIFGTILVNFIFGTILVMVGVLVVSMQDWIKRKLHYV